MKEGEPNPPGVGVPQVCDALGCRLHLGDAAARVLQHYLAVRVQAQPPVHPVEKRRPGLALEAGQRA